MKLPIHLLLLLFSLVCLSFLQSTNETETDQPDLTPEQQINKKATERFNQLRQEAENMKKADQEMNQAAFDPNEQNGNIDNKKFKSQESIMRGEEIE